MGSLCLSTLSILRCAPLSRTENIALIIPPALEIIFATSLIVTNWGMGWRHLLLTADSWSYLLLALLDLFSHILPAVRDDLDVYSAVDTVLGAMSFIPILFYTTFLFFFTRAELLDILPRRFQNVAQFTLLIFVPAIVGLNEVASLLGISHIRNGDQLLIGFKDDRDHTLWFFFSSMTLALHTAYQAINFCFAFFRLVKSFLNQRDLEASSSDRAYLFKGTGWISGGLKLGAIETVVGFAQAGFGGAITRRILRFLGHACLSIGIVQGLDTMENFGEFREVMSSRSTGRPRARRISNPRALISGPRLSTFRQLSPTATDFHITPRATGHASSDRGLAPRATNGLAGLADFVDLKTEKAAQRVTIHFGEGVPKLHMRFSVLDMPSPATLIESHSHSNPVDDMNNRLSEYQATVSRVSSTKHLRAVSQFSTQTADSFQEAAKDIMPHFPALPAKAFMTERQSWVASPEPLMDSEPIRGKAPIQMRLSQLVTLHETDEEHKIALSGNLTRRPTTKYHVPSHMNARRYSERTPASGGGTFMESGTATTQTTPATDNPFKYDEDEGFHETVDEDVKVRHLVPDGGRPETGRDTADMDGIRDVPSQWIQSTDSGIVERYRKPSLVSFLPVMHPSNPASPVINSTAAHVHNRSVSWVQSPYDNSIVAPRGKYADLPPHNGSPKRIVSGAQTQIKKVARRVTPSPNPLYPHLRGSIHIEPIMIPPRAPGMVGVEAVQGSDAGSSYAGSPLRNDY